MKTFSKIILISIIFILIYSFVVARTTMTVYNQNLATVKTNISLQLERGINTYSFANIPSAIQPTSVHLRPVDKSDELYINLQNYEYDLVSSSKILQKYIDKKISVATKQGDLFTGTLKSSDSNAIVIQSDKGIEIINRSEVQNIQLLKMPEDFYTKPTLNWELYSGQDGNCETELSYITRNISWNAQYVAVLTPDDKSLNLSSWISLDNNSGKSYEDVSLKLMAGEINLAEPKYPRYREQMDVAMASKGGPPVEEKEFFEYHLYTVKQRKLDIKNNQQKQLTLFDPTDVDIKKTFHYNCNSKGKVDVLVTFVNKESAGLGIPLPKGKIRVFKDDEDGNSEFIGEDNIEHTPRNEELELQIGKAFDIKAEFTTLSQERPTTKSRKEKYEIELRNQKKEDVTVEVIKTLGGNWQIIDTEHKYSKEDANTVKFVVDVNAESKKKFTFTVLWRW
ncbi:MAG: DUF4139 domain-containing protein [Candidatus Cloacimonetes bacterium]|nr:DUF4139 domain-containing protein [Candidatus Cloacimonadota bacterium]MBS3768009.1 DUF4139 domain-containing protein [Candidatus Cloacimonadota bacterium]